LAADVCTPDNDNDQVRDSPQVRNSPKQHVAFNQTRGRGLSTAKRPQHDDENSNGLRLLFPT